MSIRWKIALIFTLCVGMAVSVICGIHTYTIFKDGSDSFAGAVQSVFTEAFKTRIRQTAEKAEYTFTSTDGNGVIVNQQMSDHMQEIYDMIFAEGGRLGLGPGRYFALIDSAGKPVLISDSQIDPQRMEKTSVIVSALGGREEMDTSFTKGYMDYAYPFVPESGGQYAVYVHENKSEIYQAVSRLYQTYLKCLLAALILSFFAAGKLAASLTAPIRRLNDGAKKLAAGDDSMILDEKGTDEIGQLAKTMLELSHSIDVSATEKQNEQNKLETILLNMTDGILAFDYKGKLIHINPEAKRLLGREYLDDIDFDKFFREINANITLGDILYMDQDESLEREVSIHTDRVVTLNFAAFTLENKIKGIVVVIHDVTKQEKLEQARRNFVADVSHELRTPITTIRSYSETLAETPDIDEDTRARFLNVISSEANRMTRIISDLLTLSELDNKHKYPKIYETIDIRKMVESVTERLSMAAQEKNQKLVYSPINDVPVIDGDRDGLERVLINIINNALKYTPADGRIDVFTSRVYNDICVKVSDNGIGIPEENLPHIFDRFYRVDKARTRDTGGTGLGLAIAKQIIETSFGGKIMISSRLNEGTEVTITIPLPAK